MLGLNINTRLLRFEHIDNYYNWRTALWALPLKQGLRYLRSKSEIIRTSTAGLRYRLCLSRLRRLRLRPPPPSLRVDGPHQVVVRCFLFILSS